MSSRARVNPKADTQQLAEDIRRASSQVPQNVVYTSGRFTAQIGQVNRVRGTVLMLLPPADQSSAGGETTVLLEGGTLTVVCPSGTVNALTSLVFSAPGAVTFKSSGKGGWYEVGVNANGSIPNAALAPMPANTVKGNPTGSTATPQDSQVATGQIANSAVTTAKIANAAVTYAKLDQFATDYECQIANPAWLDDMLLVETPPTTTGILRTRQGAWRFVVSGGTWTITQPAFNNAVGVVRFATNTNSTQMELFEGIAGGAPFRFEDFRSWGKRVRLRTAITGVRLFCGVLTSGGAAAVFDYEQTTSVNLRARTRNGAGAFTADVSSGVVWAAGDSHHLRVDKASNGDLLFYVDGALTNTITAATHGIVNADALAVYFFWSRATTVAEVEVDYIGMRGGGR